MKKNGSTVPPESKQLISYLEQTSLVDWIGKNGSKLIGAFFLLVVLFIAVFRWGVSSTGKSEGSFINASHYFSNFEKAIEENRGDEMHHALTALLSTMKEQPSLQAKYDGIMAQLLLATNEVEQALPLAKDTLKRTAADRLEDYRSYSETTLLMGQGKMEEALARAKGLQEKLLQGEKKEESLLIEYNLLRLAALEGQLGHKEEERIALLEWQKTGQQLGHAISSGGISLAQFISTRLAKQ
jgi:hypothetical protein